MGRTPTPMTKPPPFYEMAQDTSFIFSRGGGFFQYRN